MKKLLSALSAALILGVGAQIGAWLREERIRTLRNILAERRAAAPCNNPGRHLSA